MLHPVAGLRPTRRLKRPAHPDGHRCGVPQFAGVLSVQDPDTLHNGGRTRLPVSSLFENLESGATVEEFLEWFDGAEEWRLDAFPVGIHV